MTLAQYIRSQFPSPVSGRNPANTDNPACYCVGGSLIMYKRRMVPYNSWESMRFPSGAAITMVLREYQPFLMPGRLAEYAAEIIQANDDGNFDTAWRVLERALAGCVDHP